MAFLFKKLIQRLLKLEAKIYLARVNPYVIVIAGTTNRYWIKEGIVDALLTKNRKCRTNKKNFNAEIGLPLSVLGLLSIEGDNVFKRWSKTIYHGLKIALWGKPVDFLVLEMAIDKPDDMEYLLGIVHPQAAIFTTITMIYPENFENLDAVATEYKKLIKTLPPNGMALLNADDQRIHKLKDYAKCPVITYGIENKNVDYLAESIQRVSSGQEFKMHMPDLKIESVKINRFGQHHIYAELAKKIIISQLGNSVSK